MLSVSDRIRPFGQKKRRSVSDRESRMGGCWGTFKRSSPGPISGNRRVVSKRDTKTAEPRGGVILLGNNLFFKGHDPTGAKTPNERAEFSPHCNGKE